MRIRGASTASGNSDNIHIIWVGMRATIMRIRGASTASGNSDNIHIIWVGMRAIYHAYTWCFHRIW